MFSSAVPNVCFFNWSFIQSLNMVRAIESIDLYPRSKEMQCFMFAYSIPNIFPTDRGVYLERKFGMQNKLITCAYINHRQKGHMVIVVNNYISTTEETEDLLNRLESSKIFSVIDLRNAF